MSAPVRPLYRETALELAESARTQANTKRVADLPRRGGPGAGWYIVNRATAASPVAEVDVYGDIGGFGVTASSLLASLNGAREANLRINSGGGDVFEALSLYNRLSELRRVTVTVDGVAASAASVVAMAASPGCLAMAPHSRLMIHEAWAGQAGGTAAELAALAAVVDGLSDEIAAVYAKRTGRPASFWRAQMKQETWYTAQEAVAEGLADYVVSADPVKALMAAQVRACLAGLRRGNG